MFGIKVFGRFSGGQPT